MVTPQGANQSDPTSATNAITTIESQETSTPSSTTTSAQTITSSTYSTPSQTVTSSTSSTSISSPPTSETTYAAYPKSSSSNNGSSGVLAGAVVGAGVGAALLTFIFTFLFFRSKSQKHSKRHRYSEKQYSAGNGNIGKALPKEPQEDILNTQRAWEKHLPQPADDNTIRSRVQSLFHLVEFHVENFYADSVATFSMTDELQTELLKVDSPYLSDSVVKLLPQVRPKTVLIKHCLAQLILANISAEGITGHSFLPSEFVALPRAIKMARSSESKPEYNQALSYWRVLSFYLRPKGPDDQMYIPQRDSAIVTAAEIFCKAFYPLAGRGGDDAARGQNLVEVMKSAADTGILIFSQPSTFKYRWTMPKDARSSRKVVVTPAFVKVADDNGQLLDRPQTMIQQVTEEI